MFLFVQIALFLNNSRPNNNETIDKHMSRQVIVKMETETNEEPMYLYLLVLQ